MENPQHDPSMEEELREYNPRVEGLSEEENSEIYSGNTENVVSRINFLNPNERRAAIKEISDSIVSCIKVLSDQIKAAEAEPENSEKTNEYRKNIEILHKLHSEILSIKY